MSDGEVFTEQLRREIAERMDVLMHDAMRLAEKHGREASPGDRLSAASALAAGMATQYAAEALAAEVAKLAAETAKAVNKQPLAPGRMG